MATARSFWKGHLRLALVTIPIRLVSATSAEDKIALHQVDRKSKQRIRYQKVAGETGKVVPQSDIVQGYELDDGTYVLFEPDELDKLKLTTRHTVELTEFVDACSIDPLYFDNPYYVLPDGDVAEEGYRIIRDALKAAKKYGVGQLTMRGRENLIAMKPIAEGLMIETLRYESEVRNADEIFEGIGKGKLRPELIDMAKQLIDERTREFDASAFKNHYADALRKLVKEKVEGGEFDGSRRRRRAACRRNSDRLHGRAAPVHRKDARQEHSPESEDCRHPAETRTGQACCAEIIKE